jgi:hypothetical protein
MTVEELNKRFDNIITEATTNAGTQMVQIGTDALAMIQRRIMGGGKNAEGSQYPPYSTKPMLSGCSGFLDKSKCPAKTKGGRKDLKWATIQRNGNNYHLFEIPGGYNEFRRLNGLQSSFVDFAFSGRMWKNITIVSDSTEHNNGVVRISAKSEEDMKKLEGNTKRKGDILKLSQSEIKDLATMHVKNIVQIIHTNGL